MKKSHGLAGLLLVCGCLPAGAKTLDFSGRTWEVKDSREERIGPGKNLWSADNAWVDRSGFLRLKISYDPESGNWYSAEVFTTQPSRYGAHRFFVIGRLDRLDKNVVFSPFLYKDDSHELDIEFSAWGRERSKGAEGAQFVVQPSLLPGNKRAFAIRLTGDYTTHSLDWSRERVVFTSVHGHYREPPGEGYLIGAWSYRGPSIPAEEEGLRTHLNLWLHKGRPPSDGREVEVVVAGVELP